jgi:hypothetical protein
MLAGVNLSDDQHVCHHCDNPSCVNPNHLFIGTHADNMRDMAAKGRAAFGSSNLPDACRRPGSAHHNAKLTESIVKKIRASEATNRELAKHYGVSHVVICLARNGKTWRHV